MFLFTQRQILTSSPGRPGVPGSPEGPGIMEDTYMKVFKDGLRCIIQQNVSSVGVVAIKCIKLIAKLQMCVITELHSIF